ncbi:MAG: tetratricopeptide repeat protein [Cumulibacter sp.]
MNPTPHPKCRRALLIAASIGGVILIAAVVTAALAYVRPHPEDDVAEAETAQEEEREQETPPPPVSEDYQLLASARSDLEAGDRETAIAKLESADALRTNNAEVLLELGWVYIDAGRRNEARGVLERASAIFRSLRDTENMANAEEALDRIGASNDDASDDTVIALPPRAE